MKTRKGVSKEIGALYVKRGWSLVRQVRTLTLFLRSFRIDGAEPSGVTTGRRQERTRVSKTLRPATVSTPDVGTIFRQQDLWL